ncbi:MAG TPA: carbamoyltransferase N-terminal domain-containing protein, partial [Methylomirabilota bacterium]|nr:carbamoyltransferase N-terminal domain-containing protein [Methylomirabilota bacterium]
MYVLGIAGQVHDAAVALLKDGEIVAAAEEERFSRQKFMGMLQCEGVPSQSLRYCLATAGITLDEVDHIAYFFRPFVELWHQARFDARRALRRPATGLFYMFQKAELCKAHLKTIGLLRMQQRRPSRVHYVEHHKAHAASCHFLSGEAESAVLVMDAIGEHASTTWYHAVGADLRRLKTIDYPHSLGMLYAQVTRFCGFTPWSDEYKLMGLASFGEPRYLDAFRDVIQSRPGGEYRINLDYLHPSLKGPDLLGPKFFATFGPARRKDETVTDHYTSIAASLQRRLEEVALDMAAELHRRTGTRHLCVTGGVAHNCSMNGKLRTQSPFTKLTVHNASGDTGTALGAALYVWHSVLGHPIRTQVGNHAYLGPSYSNARILAALRAAKCTAYREYDEEPLLETTAKSITNGEIVGWFQGGMEWGPRALGARSILADATNPKMKDILNKWVKHR